MTVGSSFDVYDQTGFHKAIVLEQEGSTNDSRRVLVHYHGWNHKWDEWVTDFSRIRPLGTTGDVKKAAAIEPKATPAANRTKPVAERVAEPMELAEEQTPLVNCTTSSGRMSQKVQRYQPILSGSGMGNERGDVQRSSNAVGFCNFQLVDVSAEPPSHPNVAAAAAAECSASGWRRNGRGAQAGCCAITDDFQAQDPPRSRVVLLREIAISPACG